VLGIEAFDTSAAGCRCLVDWLRAHGEINLVGVEGTGSYGAGLCRHLTGAGIAVVEVDRPNRQVRRREGKTDTIDAVAAARAALSGQALGRAKSRNGDVEAIRVLQVACRSAASERIATLNQLRHLVICADDQVRSRFDGLSSGSAHRRDRRAAKLLVAAGDNPDRLHSEAAFAHLCGVAPLEASSGKTRRHRLNRGGNRQANSALYRVVITRMASHPPTKAYVARRRADGKSTGEIVRILKRYVAREAFKHRRPATANAT
jgi:transposase